MLSIHLALGRNHAIYWCYNPDFLIFLVTAARTTAGKHARSRNVINSRKQYLFLSQNGGTGSEISESGGAADGKSGLSLKSILARRRRFFYTFLSQKSTKFPSFSEHSVANFKKNPRILDPARLQKHGGMPPSGEGNINTVRKHPISNPSSAMIMHCK